MKMESLSVSLGPHQHPMASNVRRNRGMARQWNVFAALRKGNHQQPQVQSLEAPPPPPPLPHAHTLPSSASSACNSSSVRHHLLDRSCDGCPPVPWQTLGPTSSTAGFHRNHAADCEQGIFKVFPDVLSCKMLLITNPNSVQNDSLSCARTRAVSRGGGVTGQKPGSASC